MEPTGAFKSKDERIETVPLEHVERALEGGGPSPYARPTATPYVLLAHRRSASARGVVIELSARELTDETVASTGTLSP
jgi:hypothetical protein